MFKMVIGKVSLRPYDFFPKLITIECSHPCSYLEHYSYNDAHDTSKESIAHNDSSFMHRIMY